MFDKVMVSSDLDAFRSDGVVRTASITFSGTLPGAGEMVRTTTPVNITGLDFFQIQFENSVKHSGKWRDIVCEDATFVGETTTPGDLVTGLETTTDTSGNLTITGRIINPYAGALALTTTTINFRIICYDSTLI